MKEKNIFRHKFKTIFKDAYRNFKWSRKNNFTFKKTIGYIFFKMKNDFFLALGDLRGWPLKVYICENCEVFLTNAYTKCKKQEKLDNYFGIMGVLVFGVILK